MPDLLSRKREASGYAWKDEKIAMASSSSCLGKEAMASLPSSTGYTVREESAAMASPYFSLGASVISGFIHPEGGAIEVHQGLDNATQGLHSLYQPIESLLMTTAPSLRRKAHWLH